jgi:formylglycine-generating enzyme required for sulfatase activity
VQWDLVLKHLSVKGVSDSELKTDSTDWGNYYNTTYEITNTSAKYSTDFGASFTNAPYNKTASVYVLLTTGAYDNFSKYNIYDLAGNVREWTLEKTSKTSYPCADRGGYYGIFGSYFPAFVRDDYHPMSSYVDIGFRCALY